MDYRQPQIAELYDLANPFGPDAEFYLTLAGTEPIRVLDLGCGTGVLCCVLAGRGHQVTGVDPAGAMLTLAKSKAFAERVEWIESSAQQYTSHHRFDLIVMTGHAFQVLLTDADTLAVFRTMRQHLKPGGTVAFETRNPHVDWVGEWENRSRMLSGGSITETLKITASEGEFISFETSYSLPDKTVTTNSNLRFPSREHVEGLIARSGLIVREVFGSWNGEPFDHVHSREIIFVVGHT